MSDQQKQESAENSVEQRYQAPTVVRMAVSEVVRGGTSATPPDGFAAPADPRQT